MKTLLFALGLALLCISGPAPGAIGQDKAPTDDPAAGLWELDRDGLRQWIDLDAECEPCGGEGERLCERCKGGASKNCVECGGNRIAVCRSCGGDGKQYDPMVEMICPYCDGSALWTCPACYGEGSYSVTGGSRQGQRCGPCKQVGFLECKACKGKRRFAALKVGGGKPGKASTQSVEKTREVLQESIAMLKDFHPSGRESDDRKELDAALKKASRNLPGLKDVKKLFDADMKALRGQAQYVGYERYLIKEFKLFRKRSIRMMEKQLVVLALCDRRLDFNQRAREK